jgi:DNA-binding MarR family transcriptional regulator
LINANKNIRQLDLCDSLRIKNSNLVAFVASLESRGLAMRRGSKTDRRVNFLEITPKGSKTLEKAFKIQAEHREYISSKLTDIDFNNLIFRLQKLADMNKKY